MTSSFSTRPHHAPPKNEKGFAPNKSGRPPPPAPFRVLSNGVVAQQSLLHAWNPRMDLFAFLSDGTRLHVTRPRAAIGHGAPGESEGGFKVFSERVRVGQRALVAAPHLCWSPDGNALALVVASGGATRGTELWVYDSTKDFERRVVAGLHENRGGEKGLTPAPTGGGGGPTTTPPAEVGAGPSSSSGGVVVVGPPPPPPPLVPMQLCGAGAGDENRGDNFFGIVAVGWFADGASEEPFLDFDTDIPLYSMTNTTELEPGVGGRGDLLPGSSGGLPHPPPGLRTGATTTDGATKSPPSCSSSSLLVTAAADGSIAFARDGQILLGRCSVRHLMHAEEEIFSLHLAPDRGSLAVVVVGKQNRIADVLLLDVSFLRDKSSETKLVVESTRRAYDIFLRTLRTLFGGVDAVLFGGECAMLLSQTRKALLAATSETLSDIQNMLAACEKGLQTKLGFFLAAEDASTDELGSSSGSDGLVSAVEGGSVLTAPAPAPDWLELERLEELAFGSRAALEDCTGAPIDAQSSPRPPPADAQSSPPLFASPLSTSESPIEPFEGSGHKLGSFLGCFSSERKGPLEHARRGDNDVVFPPRPENTPLEVVPPLHSRLHPQVLLARALLTGYPRVADDPPPLSRVERNLASALQYLLTALSTRNSVAVSKLHSIFQELFSCACEMQARYAGVLFGVLFSEKDESSGPPPTGVGAPTRQEVVDQNCSFSNNKSATTSSSQQRDDDSPQEDLYCGLPKPPPQPTTKLLLQTLIQLTEELAVRVEFLLTTTFTAQTHLKTLFSVLARVVAGDGTDGGRDPLPDQAVAEFLEKCYTAGSTTIHGGAPEQEPEPWSFLVGPLRSEIAAVLSLLQELRELVGTLENLCVLPSVSSCLVARGLDGKAVGCRLGLDGKAAADVLRRESSSEEGGTTRGLGHEKPRLVASRPPQVVWQSHTEEGRRGGAAERGSFVPEQLASCSLFVVGEQTVVVVVRADNVPLLVAADDRVRIVAASLHGRATSADSLLVLATVEKSDGKRPRTVLRLFIADLSPAPAAQKKFPPDLRGDSSAEIRRELQNPIRKNFPSDFPHVRAGDLPVSAAEAADIAAGGEEVTVQGFPSGRGGGARASVAVGNRLLILDLEG